MVGQPSPRRSNRAALAAARSAVPEFRTNAKGEWIMTLAVFKAADPGEVWKRLMRGRNRV